MKSKTPMLAFLLSIKSFKLLFLPLLQSILASWMYDSWKDNFPTVKAYLFNFDESLEQALYHALESLDLVQNTNKEQVKKELSYYKQALLSHLINLTPTERLRYVRQDVFEVFYSEVRKSPIALHHLSLKLLYECHRNHKNFEAILRSVVVITQQTLSNTEKLLDGQVSIQTDLHEVKKSLFDIQSRFNVNINVDNVESNERKEQILARDLYQAQKLNEYFYSRLPQVIEKGLFSKIDSKGLVSDLEKLLSDSWCSFNSHVILLADGGMGKSTMLLMFCRQSTAPSLYIPAEDLMVTNRSLEIIV